MARRKNKPESIEEKNVLADRLRTVRVELFGERGGSMMARQLNLPVRTWYNYESGVTVPAETILRFMKLTSAEPMWLLDGTGPRYRTPPGSALDGSSESVRDLLCIALQRLEQRDSRAANPATRRGRPAAVASATTGSSAPAQPAHAQASGNSVETRPAGTTSADLASKTSTIAGSQAYQCVQVEDDAMSPSLSQGEFVFYSEHEEPPQRLADKLVVAWVNDQPQVRRFELSGTSAVLRAENPEYASRNLTFELDSHEAAGYRLRRVVGTSTPHSG